MTVPVICRVGADCHFFFPARAYFISSSDDPENLARADAALQELVASIDASTDHVRINVLGVNVNSQTVTLYQGSSEYQQLRWMRLAILKRKKTGDSTLLDGESPLEKFTVVILCRPPAHSPLCCGT